MLKIAVICIGDELLKGSTVNTNLAHIGKALTETGCYPLLSLTVPDKKEDILDALDISLARADWVITTGGLGPTADDVTKEFIARELGLRLEEDSETTVRILKYWKARHTCEEMPPRILNQALVPSGAEVLPNANGTAPGLLMKTPADYKYPGRTLILLPGPPGEMGPIFDRQVLPLIRENSGEKIHTRLFRLGGIGEPQVEDKVLDILAKRHPLSAAYCAEPGMVRLFLSSENPETLAEAAADVKSIFAGELFAERSESLAQEIIRILRREEAVLATAESCTGGMVAKLITDIPGSSDVYAGSVVSYANRIKADILGVKSGTLDEYGAVSAETAEEMVRGIADKFRVDAACSLTGIAGPDGGSPEKPVGLVYAGIYWKGEVETHKLHFRGSRERVRAGAAAAALNLLRKKMLGL